MVDVDGRVERGNGMSDLDGQVKCVFAIVVVHVGHGVFMHAVRLA